MFIRRHNLQLVLYAVLYNYGSSKSSDILNLPLAQPNSGIFWCTLETEEASFTGKIIILRKPPAMPGRLDKAMPCRA
jgi:hypothetical protein